MARSFAVASECDYSEIDVTLPGKRECTPIGADDVVFFGVPVYRESAKSDTAIFRLD